MKANKLFARVLASWFAASTLVGCVSGKGGREGGNPAPPPDAGSTAADASAFYAEHTLHGKVYVVGSTNSFLACIREEDLPQTVMKVGVGPEGEAVVLETSTQDPSLEERLWREYQKRNLYYVEEVEAGQTHVLGSLMSHYNFLRERKAPHSETVEINGNKVVFESDPERPGLAKRLKERYAREHPAP